jgi:hypothetical protein
MTGLPFCFSVVHVSGRQRVPTLVAGLCLGWSHPRDETGSGSFASFYEVNMRVFERGARWDSLSAGSDTRLCQPFACTRVWAVAL